MTASADASTQVKSLAADVERSLSMAGNATAESITTGAREAQNTLITASTEAANHVKSLAVDVERTLITVGTNAASSILGTRAKLRARFPRPPPSANQIKAIAADMERSLGVAPPARPTPSRPPRRTRRALIAATNEVSTKVKSTSADIERSVLAASSNFGSTMTGKTDKIVTYVRADRPSGADRRQPPRFAGRGAEHQSHATDNRHRPRHRRRLKSIETRGQSFAIDVDPRLGSRAHDHDRGRPRHRRGGRAEGPRTGVAFGHRPVAQVSIAAVTEMRRPARSCAPIRWRCSNGCVKATFCCRKC